MRDRSGPRRATSRSAPPACVILDARWRLDDDARRATAAGREVLLALLELCAARWASAGGRIGHVPAELLDAQVLADHLDDVGPDAIARLRAGVASCFAVGLLVRASAGEDAWISGAFLGRMLARGASLCSAGNTSRREDTPGHGAAASPHVDRAGAVPAPTGPAILAGLTSSPRGDGNRAAGANHDAANAAGSRS